MDMFPREPTLKKFALVMLQMSPCVRRGRRVDFRCRWQPCPLGEVRLSLRSLIREHFVFGPRDVGALRRTVRALELSRLLTPRDLEELRGDAKGKWPARQSLAASRGWPG